MNEQEQLMVTERYTVGQMLDDQPIIERNISTILEQASLNDITHGLQWYKIAHTIAGNMAKQYQRSLSDIIGIIAVLSPGCQWDKNVFDAISVIEHGSNAIVSTYGPNKNKAVSITMGHSPDFILSGHKVTAFYTNLLTPENDEHITIDSHATRAGCDWVGQYAPQKFNKDGKYRVLENSYFSIARRQQMLGNQTQAIAWLTYKHLYRNRRDANYQLPEYLFNPNDQWIHDEHYLDALANAKRTSI